VFVGPPVLDFGSVCLRSISTKYLEIVNNLDQNVLVVAEVRLSTTLSSSIITILKQYIKALIHILNNKVVASNMLN
jgi:hypothetical protein